MKTLGVALINAHLSSCCSATQKNPSASLILHILKHIKLHHGRSLPSFGLKGNKIRENQLKEPQAIGICSIMQLEGH